MYKGDRNKIESISDYKHRLEFFEMSQRIQKKREMKAIKSFRITPENEKLLKGYSKEQDRSQSWIVNQAIEKYFNGKVLKSETYTNKMLKPIRSN